MNVGSLTWDVARAGGLVAFALLTASVALGLALSLGWRSPRWTRFVTNEVHRFVTLLALVFMAVHGVAIAVDPFIKMSLPQVLIPFLSTYRPVWVALGITAGYLALAVYLSERVRGRVGYAWWRRFHAFAFLAFAMALVHGIATGSDTRTPWGLALYGGSLFLVGFLLILRLFPDPPKRSRPVTAGLAITAVALTVGFTLLGPLQPGWNARAGGTVAAASAGGGAATGATGGTAGGAASGPGGSGGSGGQASPAPAGLGIATSSALPFDGQIARSAGALQVQGQLHDGSAAFLVQLASGTGGTITGKIVLQTGNGQTCQGGVGAVGDTTIDATCSTPDGSSWSLRVAVTNASRNQINGTILVSPASGGLPGSARPAGTSG
jgi:hypothetical protein